MANETPVEEQLNQIGQALRQQPSQYDAVMRRVTRETLQPSRARWRLSVRQTAGRMAALAACAAVLVALWTLYSGPGGGATEAYAAAIQQVEQARTFSARAISRSVDEAGKERVLEMVTMFKEPSLERIEYGKGFPAPEISIRNYATRRSIQLLPNEKIARTQDLHDLFSVDKATGQVRQAQLETSVRDDVVKLASRAAKDVGVVQLDGRAARVLRSDDGKEPIKTVWVDRATNQPLKIEVASPSTKSSFTYESIRIDEPLDDALFSLTAPEGYVVKDEPDARNADDKAKAQRELNGKMLSKVRAIVMECYMYAEKHDGKFPDQLNDLVRAGTSAEALKALMASPDKPDGPAVIEYCKPRANKDSSTEIVVFEKPEFRRNGNVVAGMADGHAEVLSAEEFEKRMK